MKLNLLLPPFAVLLVCAASATAVTIDMVAVGNPGNTRNNSNNLHLGAVNHTYAIGKYEVTAGQYTEFLNAIAKDDPYGVYKSQMGDPLNAFGANIQRSDAAPNFSYSVAADWANRPVNWVTFWDAARFANWLHNGQPTGPQGAGTTEDGAYLHIGDHANFARQPGAKFFIPTEDEWYKAAFHKNDGVTGNYWEFPTASNSQPLNTLPDTGNHANFVEGGSGSFTIGAPYFRTEVGAFTNSPSPYGTFDQGGNVWEWNESIITFADRRGQIGGSYDHTWEHLHASAHGEYTTEIGNSVVGFRIASYSVPEPGIAVLSIVVGMAGLFWRRRTRRTRA